jgi:hypothetical protein
MLNQLSHRHNPDKHLHETQQGCNPALTAIYQDNPDGSKGDVTDPGQEDYERQDHPGIHVKFNVGKGLQKLVH